MTSTTLLTSEIVDNERTGKSRFLHKSMIQQSAVKQNKKICREIVAKCLQAAHYLQKTQ